ncbi:hypothetical protein AVEN_220248-1 [Araneus ventricosus]|uniref:Uncharacterized protein n=1 Tax=Araneus ventricosus TaxID=182803 RepID=A0A4Y2D3B6_ARAVE|nr:hypothetical protein AVEN_1774-1 [Araneus ventricosus]GBM11162.1 hypothetical protein AVEN_45671-1 [Araneus ventricosus]GBM11220.1 hypothetical protein AVEN_176257-1 [Araneus ventricosus]GBM11234.1 hypothetical protein AVEN_220248-1 [Araneus ventricosus]
MISKFYIPHDFICGTAINAIIPTPLPLGQGSLLEILFCTASGKENREHCCLRGRDCLFGQLISFLIPQVPYMGSNPTQPDVRSVIQRVFEWIWLLDYWISGLIGLSGWIGCRSRSLLVWVVLGIFNRFLESY